MAETKASGMTIVISGTSRGIGKYIAEKLIEKGNTVVGLARSPAAIEGAGYVHIRADVTDERQVVAAFGEIRRRFGKIDALINNAGVASMNPYFGDINSRLSRYLKTTLSRFLIDASFA